MSVILIGDSPAISVCAIYLQTANIDCTVLNHSLNLSYSTTAVGGVPDVSTFAPDTMEQAEYVGVKVVQVKEIENIKYLSNEYTISADGVIYTGEALVLDNSTPFSTLENLSENDSLYTVEKRIREIKEGIVIAGIGCKIAHSIREGTK